MEFVLRYRGGVPGKAVGTLEDKMYIREYFHPQLKEVCRRFSFFEPATSMLVPVAPVVGRRLEPERPLGNLLFRKARVAGREYLPLITRLHHLACELDILWLRREQPGDIVHGGDLDNRLKNLLDGLRMPHADAEVRRPLNVEEDPCYCLLEDDALITKLTVNTHQLLEPLGETDHRDAVDLIILVTVVSTLPIMANIGLNL